jgi:DNA-binding MarR family transcriptional regulator
MYHPYLAELGLTYTQYITMLVLWERQKISAKDLGTKLHLDSGTLTPVLKSLEKKGLIGRYRSEEDERVLVVELTEEGHALADEFAETFHQAEEHLSAQFTAEEEAQLRALLNRLITNLEVSNK